jgi:superfamily I DNA/RNA helicase
MIKLTDEQAKILEDFKKYPDKDLIINAYAGTGKTTTLKMIAEENPRVKFMYLAFNKKIVEEARKKFPKNVTVKTAHALAYQGVELFKHPGKLERKRYPYDTLLNQLPRDIIKINGLDRKAATDFVRDLIRYYEFSDGQDFDRSYTEYKFKHVLQASILAEKIDLKKLGDKKDLILDYFKANSLDFDEETLDGFIDMIEKIKKGDKRYKVVSSMKKVDRRLITAVLSVMDFPLEDYEECVEQFLDYLHSELSHFWQMFSDLDSDVPFEHSTYLKLYHLMKPIIKGYDCILFDEAQDANPVILDIVKNQEHCRKVWVGDKHQAIYQFTGAINTIEKIMGDPTCHTLYLTKSFRFGSNISSIANKILQEKIKRDEFADKKNNPTLVGLGRKKPGKDGGPVTILCRSNAGVIDEAISLLDDGEDSIYIGDSIGDAALNDMEDVYHLLCFNKKMIKNYYIKTFEDIAELSKEAKFKGDSDLTRIIKIVMEYRSGNFLNLVEQLRSISKVNISYTNPKYQIITAHKAKGLEWPSVRIAEDFDKVFMNDNNSLRKTISDEEFNLLYVASTRAESSLVFSSKLENYFS